MLVFFGDFEFNTIFSPVNRKKSILILKVILSYSNSLDFLTAASTV